jgi:uncharacterized protein (TIGR00369 family)
MVTMEPDIKAFEKQLRHVFEEVVPFNRVLGLKVEALDWEAPKLRFDMRPELIGNPVRKVLHGGVISATLDVVAGFAIHLALFKQNLDEGKAFTFPNIGTIDLRVDYLRPGRGEFFIGTGRVVRLGNRVAVAHMDLVNDKHEQIATGGAAYIVG